MSLFIMLNNEVMEKQYKVYVITYRKQVPAGVYVFCYRTVIKDLYKNKLRMIENSDKCEIFSTGIALSDSYINRVEMLSFSLI